jgi:predicted dehydrogenase
MAGIDRRVFLGSSARMAAGAALSAPLLAAARAESSAPTAPIKIGQIGTGHAHAAGKMAALRKLAADYEVVGVVEPDETLRRQWQDDSAYRDLRWMTEEELLATAGLKAVAVETTVADLVPTAVRCIRAGMHLHLDKPAGDSLPAFKTLLDEASRRQRCVQMGYMFRNNSAFQFCFRAIREGWLGDIFEVHAVISKKIATDRRGPLAEYAGGTMFELGCHLIDAVLAAMGPPEKVTPFIRRTHPDQDDLADNMLAVLEYPQATCTVRSALVEVEGGRRRQFVVCGTQGTIDIRPLEPPKLLLALEEARGPFNRGYQEVELPPMPGRYDDQLAELARVIRGEEDAKYPPAHDLAVQETILRASGMPLD